MKFDTKISLNLIIHKIADSARISLLHSHGSSDYVNACFIDVSEFTQFILDHICDIV